MVVAAFLTFVDPLRPFPVQGPHPERSLGGGIGRIGVLAGRAPDIDSECLSVDPFSPDEEAFRPALNQDDPVFRALSSERSGFLDDGVAVVSHGFVFFGFRWQKSPDLAKCIFA